MNCPQHPGFQFDALPCPYCLAAGKAAIAASPAARALMGESFREQVTRVMLIAEDVGDTWDLSLNDQAALKAVLSRMSVLDEQVASLVAIVRRVADLSALVSDFDKEYALIKDARALLERIETTVA